MLPTLLLPLLPIGHALFNVIVRHAQRRGCRVLYVGAVNYIVASLANLALALSRGPMPASPRTWLLALPAGLTYALTFRTINSSMSRRGLAVPSAVMQLSVVVPLAFSVLAWGERPTLLQGAGIALALGALILLTADKAKPTEAALLPAAASAPPLLLAALFLLQGGAGLAPKAFAELGAPAEQSAFLVLLFGTAALTFLPDWLSKGRPSRQDLLWGAALGLTNAVANLLTVYVLGALPGILVFPVITAGALLITSGLGLIAWREPIGRWGRVGMAVALGAVLLVSTGR